MPNPNQVRVAALELFEACCAAAPGYLGSAVHCRVCLQKLLPLYQVRVRVSANPNPNPNPNQVSMGAALPHTSSRAPAAALGFFQAC